MSAKKAAATKKSQPKAAKAGKTSNKKATPAKVSSKAAAAALAYKVAKAKTSPPAKPAAIRSDKPITNGAGRKTANGVLHPTPESVGGQLWAIADKLMADLGRAPQRFEFRAAVAKENEKWETPFTEQSVSFNYFTWRKYHGVPARALDLYPKKNSFEPNIKTGEPRKRGVTGGAKVARPAAKKAATKNIATVKLVGNKGTGKVTGAKVATKKAPAKKATGVKGAGKTSGQVAAVKKGTAAKKSAGAVKPVGKAKPVPKPETVKGKGGARLPKLPSQSPPKTAKSTPSLQEAASPAPAVSSRLTKASQRASSVPEGGITVIPEAPEGE